MSIRIATGRQVQAAIHAVGEILGLFILPKVTAEQAEIIAKRLRVLNAASELDVQADLRITPRRMIITFDISIPGSNP